MVLYNLFLLVIFSFSSYTYGQVSNVNPNTGYYYIPTTDNFYKLHVTPSTFNDAKTSCENENALLFHPKDENEFKIVTDFWKNMSIASLPNVFYTGIYKIDGSFRTVDGVSEPYTDWNPGEPNNLNNNEFCVQIRTKMNDVPCSREYSFMCKRPPLDQELNSQCHTSIYGFGYAEELGKCYKLHLTPKTWSEAREKCRAEHSDLAVINSHEEAAYLVKLTNSIPKIRIPGTFKHGIVLLGFHKKDVEDWQTIEDISLNYSGYACWGNKQPDGGSNQQCGSMYYNGHLNDIECDEKAFFICEQPVNPDYYAYEPLPQFPAQQSLKCYDTI